MNNQPKYETKTEALEAYKQYIISHIKHVKETFLEYGSDLITLVTSTRSPNNPTNHTSLYNTILSNIEIHDQSKFSPEEFEPYAARFYPWKDISSSYTSKQIRTNFTNAWIHHYSINKHHPEYWKHHSQSQNFDSNEIPNEYFVEMLCDWVGVSKTIQGSVYEWWNGVGDSVKYCGKKEKEKILNKKDMELCEIFVNKYKEQFYFKK